MQEGHMTEIAGNNFQTCLGLQRQSSIQFWQFWNYSNGKCHKWMNIDVNKQNWHSKILGVDSVKVDFFEKTNFWNKL